MNRIARTLTNLTVAAGLATAALTVGATAAHAGEPGPVIVLPPAEPQPPKGPGDIKVPTPDPQPPVGPGDVKAPAPKPEPPKGPQDLAQPKDKPKDPKPADPGPGTSKPTKPAPAQGDQPAPKAPAGAPASTTQAADGVVATSMFRTGHRAFDTDLSDAAGFDQVVPEEDGAELTWLLAGLGLAGATGLVLVTARRRRQDEQAEQI